MNKNLRFKQSRLNYINKQKNKQTNKKEHIRIIIGPIEVCEFAKIDDEISVLSLMKIFYQLLFICLLYFTKEDRNVKNMKSNVATLKIVTIMQKWQRRRE